MKNFLIACFNVCKAPILSFIEKEAVKIAISKLVQSPFLDDFRIWAIKFAVDYLVKDFAKPMVDYFFMKVGYGLEVVDGKYLLKEIQNSSSVGEWSQNADKV